VAHSRIKATSKQKCHIVDDVLSQKKKAKHCEYNINGKLKKQSHLNSSHCGASSVSSSVDVFRMNATSCSRPMTAGRSSEMLPISRGQ
jgi:hypothetical protein